jgi:hypothetical protein
MRLDLRRERKQGWLVLAGATAVALIGLWLVWDGGESAAKLAEAGEAKSGKFHLAEEVRKSVGANDALRDTLATLTKEVGFDMEANFEVKADPMYTRQPGYFFVTKRNSITDRLRKRAQEKGITEYDEYAGFGLGLHRPPSDVPPADALAPDLLRVLQLTDKVVSLALETPTPLQKLVVVPHGQPVKAIDVAPVGRPTLLREYQLTLEVRGSLTDILWLLHRLSPGREAAATDYPLVLKQLKITSENRSTIGNIQQLDCTLTVAGMSFVPQSERGIAPPRHPEAASSSVATGVSRSF